MPKYRPLERPPSPTALTAQLYPTVLHPVAEALAQTNVSESPQETP
jgi:hypothetical protein